MSFPGRPLLLDWRRERERERDRESIVAVLESERRPPSLPSEEEREKGEGGRGNATFYSSSFLPSNSAYRKAKKGKGGPRRGCEKSDLHHFLPTFRGGGEDVRQNAPSSPPSTLIQDSFLVTFGSPRLKE